MNNKGWYNPLSEMMIILAMITSIIFANVAVCKPTPAGAVVGRQTITLTTNITANKYASVVQAYSYTGEHWPDMHNGFGARVLGQIDDYIDADDNSGYWNFIDRSYISFDLASAGITDLTGVHSVTVRLYSANRAGECDFSNGVSPTFSLYSAGNELTNGYGNAPVAADFFCPDVGNRVTSQIVDKNEYSGAGWVDFPIWEENWQDTLLLGTDGKYAVFWGLDSTYDAQNLEPTWQSSKFMGFSWQGSVNLPQLVIVLDAELPSRDSTTRINAAVDNTTDGTETADNITWDTPRAAYADEALKFIINGDSGAPLVLSLVDSAGTVLNTHTDSVRTDGKYYYAVDVADNYTGFVRVTESHNNIKSDWGYVSPAVAATEEVNKTYSSINSYPQYTTPFSTYVTKAGNLMIVHWYATIGIADYGSASLRLLYLGNATPIYNQAFYLLATNYFKNSADNNNMLSRRFAVFTMDDTGTGFATYDGMIDNLNRAYSFDYEGWYQPVLWDDDSGNEVTDTVSSYWYLADATKDGLSFTLDKSNYTPGQALIARLWAGDASKVKDTLNSMKVELRDNTGAVVSTLAGVIVGQQTELTGVAPMGNGTFTARLTLTKDLQTFSYVHDLTFTVAGAPTTTTPPGGVKSIVERIQEWLAGAGWDNQGGHWLVLIIASIILYVIFNQSKLLRVAMPVAVWGAAIAFNYIDQWILVLLAGGVGLTLYGIFRNKVQGGTTD